MVKRTKQDNIQLEHHVCKRCGCGEDKPCFNETYGYCWWINRDKTVCSHCFHGLPLSNPYQFDELTKGEPQ